MDYYNNKILGKLNILYIPENTKICNKNIKYFCNNKYRIDTCIITFLLSTIFGPITVLSYIHDIYENYKIRKDYTKY